MLSQRQTLSQGLHQRPQLQQLLVAMQAQASRILELSEDATEAWLSQQLRDNPALRRRHPPPRVQEMGSSYVAAPREDEVQFGFSLSRDADLEQTLMTQLGQERAGEAELSAAAVIIMNLDDRGLLTISLEEVASIAGVELDDALDGQAVVQELEPEGCGASDIQEYLVWAVRHQFRGDKLFARLIGEYLDEFRDKNYKRIAKLSKITEEQAAEYGRKLTEVSPFPARGFASDPKEHITPTVFITRVGRDLKVEVRELPRSRVVVDKKFEDEVAKMAPGPDRVKAEEQLKMAREVVGQMEHRSSLLQRIAELAAREQRAWFDGGDESLKNLTMDAVAEKLRELRPNISRTVKGRYCIFEGRTFPLRHLFTHRSKPGRVAKFKLHAMIRQIVDAEDKKNPLSDSLIAQLLLREGVREARRTVAKHRELAGIPPVHKRRSEG